MGNLPERVIITGGGVIGSALALALDAEGVPVLLLDAQTPIDAQPPVEPVAGDSLPVQPIAVSAGSIDNLLSLGAWRPSGGSTPIACVHVSQSGSFGFARMRASELRLDALGQVVNAASLGAGVAAACAHLRYGEVRRGVSVDAIVSDEYGVTVHAGGEVITGALAVLADGGRLDGLAAALGLKARTRDYEQWALSATLKVSAPRFDGGGVAFERFHDGAPLALLPWRDGRYALVWTVSEERAAELQALDDSAFAAATGAAFGRRLGTLSQAQGRGAFPLHLRVVENVVAGRVVAIGNAAQRLHPVAGQGLNLGLRDVRALSLAIAAAARAGADIGSPVLLGDYAKARRSDRQQVIRFTDGLISVFGTRLPGAAHLRGAGLAAFAALPPLRRALASRAAGI